MQSWAHYINTENYISSQEKYNKNKDPRKENITKKNKNRGERLSVFFSLPHCGFLPSFPPNSAWGEVNPGSKFLISVWPSPGDFVLTSSKYVSQSSRWLKMTLKLASTITITIAIVISYIISIEGLNSLRQCHLLLLVPNNLPCCRHRIGHIVRN
jgi:hypothetical protein